MTQIPEESGNPSAPPRNLRLPWSIAAGTAMVILVGITLGVRAASRQNHTALAQARKMVGVIPVKETLYRAEHRYVGALLAWNESKLGPQFVSGYLTEVRCRPGAVVRKGEPLAIIEPEMAKSRSIASQKQAEALKSQLWALARESERIQGLEKKGIISVNDAERKLAGVQSEQARLEAAQAQMASSNLEVQDTIQRAPFDGEIANRYLDPGAFVHPGDFILEVVDRSKIRCSTDAPEEDHPFLVVGRSVHMRLLANSRDLDARISRVSPAADPSTRTIHFEVDLDNKDLSISVGTTAEMLILESGGSKVIQIPSSAAKVEGRRATLFVIEGDRARKKVLPFLGEREGLLFLSPDLPQGSLVVLDGRNQLEDGDPVIARPATGSTPEAGVQP